MEKGIILIVEDNREDELLILRALKKNNILNEVVAARDGQEALDYLWGTGDYEGRDINVMPVLILLDLNLPKIDGLEVLRRIRNDKRKKLLPVVILTSSSEDKDIVEGYSLGVNGYVKKPLDFNEFTEAVKYLGLYWMVLNEPPLMIEHEYLKKQMVHLDWLNLVGQMAAGIAHEIRNPMTGVRGFLQLLRGKEEFNQYKDFIKLMIGELDEANRIITKFVSLAKVDSDKLRMQSLNSIVESVCSLITANRLYLDKSLETELGDIPDLLLNEKEISQLILNLITNGLEASPPGGLVTIKTCKEHSKVVLAAQDQGKGIEQTTLDKLGTPFFTTKAEGTGLGLATCFSIANRHNAVIDIKTGPEGTIFFVKFKQ